MIGVRLQNKKREHLLNVYLNEGFEAAKPLAMEYLVTPQYISMLARKSGCSCNKAKLARGIALLNEMLAEFKIGRSDLCRSRFAEHIKLRIVAVKRLHESGLGYTYIARVMGLHESSVRYWLKPQYRAHQKLQNKIRQQRLAT